MSMVQVAQSQLEKIDEQIILLLKERMQICSDLMDRGQGSALREEEANMLSFWLEEAGERDLDEEIMDKIFRMVLMMGRRAGR